MVKINTCVFISGKGSNLKRLILNSYKHHALHYTIIIIYIMLSMTSVYILALGWAIQTLKQFIFSFGKLFKLLSWLFFSELNALFGSKRLWYRSNQNLSTET